MFDLQALSGSLTNILRPLGVGATQSAISTEAEEWVRTQLASVTREELEDETSVRSIFVMLLAILPGRVRRHFLEGLEQAVRSSRWDHTLFGAVVTGLLEGSDDGTREFMEKESLTNRDAARFLRSRMAGYRARLAGGGAVASGGGGAPPPEAPQDEHREEEPEDEGSLRFLNVLETWQIVAHNSLMRVVREEMRADPTDATVRGDAFQMDAGAAEILREKPEAVAKHLPPRQPDESEEAYFTRILADPQIGQRYREIMQVTRRVTRERPGAPEGLDALDMAVDVHAAIETVHRWFADREEEAGGTAPPGERPPPRGPRIWRGIRRAAGWFLGAHGAVAGIVAILFLLFAAMFFGGAGAIIALAFFPFILWGVGHAIAPLIMAIGFVGVFILRLIVRPLDNIWTFLRDVVTSPAGPVQRFLARQNLAAAPSNARRNPIEFFKDRSTVVTAVGFALMLVMGLFDLFGYMAGHAWGWGLVQAQIAYNALLFTCVFVFCGAFGVLGEMNVRRNMRANEQPPEGLDETGLARFEEERERRLDQQDTTISIAGWTMVAIMIIFVVLGGLQVIGGGVRLGYAYYSQDADEDCAEVVKNRRAISEAYLKTPAGSGRGLGAYCTDFSDLPVCTECREVVGK